MNKTVSALLGFLVLFSSIANAEELAVPRSTDNEVQLAAHRIFCARVFDTMATDPSVEKAGAALKAQLQKINVPSVNEALTDHPLFPVYFYFKHYAPYDKYFKGDEDRLNLWKIIHKGLIETLPPEIQAQAATDLEALDKKFATMLKSHKSNNSLSRYRPMMRNENQAEFDELAKTFEKVVRKSFPYGKSKWLNTLHEIVFLPQRLKKIKLLVDEHMDPAVLDQRLAAFWGFHHLPEDHSYMMRPWFKAKPSDIRMATDLEIGARPEDIADVGHTARGIEIPILGYTEQSGEAFSVLIPLMGAFMGKTQGEMAWVRENRRNFLIAQEIDEKDIPNLADREAVIERLAGPIDNPELLKKDLGKGWCQSTWCREEDRHADIWERIITAMVGQLQEDMPGFRESLEPLTSEMADAMEHLVDRMATEWGASSSYITAAAHAQGPLRTQMMNLIGDEIKHLTIVSAAYTYVRGPNSFRRFKDIFRVLLSFAGRREEAGEGPANLLKNDPVFVLESAYTLLLVENRIRAYVKTLPVSVLKMMFEGESDRAPFPAKTTEEMKAKRENAKKVIGEARNKLAFWDKNQRAYQDRLEVFGGMNADKLKYIIDHTLFGFSGAELSGTRGEATMLYRIKTMNMAPYFDDKADQNLARDWIRGALRQFQFDLVIEKMQGTDPDNKGTKGKRRVKAKVHSVTMISPTVFEIKIDKDPDFKFHPGQFVNVSIPTLEGQGQAKDFRSYSIASAPQDGHLMLTIKIVDNGPGSNYLASLKAGDEIVIKGALGHFSFQPAPGKNIVFISTGTGIAPLRSMVLSNEYQESKPKSTTFLFGARTPDEVLYQDELSTSVPGLKWVSAISRPAENWADPNGFKGRVTDYLRQLPANYPWNETEFYICGSNEMIQEVRNILKEKGVNPASVHNEGFGNFSGGSGTVQLSGSGQSNTQTFNPSGKTKLIDATGNVPATEATTETSSVTP